MRLIKTAAVLCLGILAAPASAVIGPQIAYSTASTIFLVNPDGTGQTTLYTAPRKASISWVDLKAGGGEVAFIENYKLKILSYDDRGLPVGSARTVSFACGTILVVDHHPSDGSVIVKDGCTPQHFWRVGAGASSADPQPLLTSSHALGGVVWSADGSRIYYEDLDGIHALDPSTGQAPVVSTSGSPWDVTRTGDRLILSTTANNYIIHDLTTGTITDGCTQAQTVRYGNNDTQMAYRSPVAHGGGVYVLVHNADCSGAPFRITGKAGAYPGLDWAAP
jgi:hypothetical protein